MYGCWKIALGELNT